MATTLRGIVVWLTLLAHAMPFTIRVVAVLVVTIHLATAAFRISS